MIQPKYSLNWNGYCWVNTPIFQQENNMQVAVNAQHDEALKHLVTRLQSVWYSHRDKFREKFNLDKKYPKDKDEAKKWFDGGNYHWDEDEYRDNCFYIFWGDKPDLDGYNKALEKMQQHKKLAEDIIRVKTDEDIRLKALHDFESATFH